MSIPGRLYRGEISYDFVRRSRIFYAFSAIVIVIGIVALIVRGLNLGIDFKGGDAFQFNANGHSRTEATQILSAQHVQDPVVQTIGGNQIRIQTKPLAPSEVTALSNALVKAYGLKNSDALSPQSVGASWGSQITDKALEGLFIFLALVVLFISIRFAGKMAVAAIVALLHDLLVTVGIYALVGFEVTPNTVIAVLTILGFSLYDTVVVFDKVRENTDGLNVRSTTTYTDAANLAVNQTLMRSINTSLIALLPVAALLFVGAGLLGAGTLKELALAQLIGIAAGAYSSIFIATPLAAQLKEREPAMKELTKRVDFLATRAPRVAAAGVMAAGGSAPVAGRGSVAVLEHPVAADLPIGPAAGGAAATAAADSAFEPGVRVPGSPMPRQTGARGGSASKRSGRPGGRGGRPGGKRKR